MTDSGTRCVWGILESKAEQVHARNTFDAASMFLGWPGKTKISQR